MWKVEFRCARSEVVHFGGSRDHSLLLHVVSILTFHSLRHPQNQTVSLIHTQLEIKWFFWDTFQTGLHLQINFTATADWWTTQNHTAREQTQPAATPWTHPISLSVLSHRLQFPKGSCIPASNSLMCLLMRHSSPNPSPPSQQSEVKICISHSDHTTSSTNLIQASFIFHKLLCCKIQINSSCNYSEVSPWHSYLSKRSFVHLAHSKKEEFCTMGGRKHFDDNKELRWSLFHAHWICRFFYRRKLI